MLNIESMHGELQTPSRLEEEHYRNIAPASLARSSEDQAPICEIISPQFHRHPIDLSALCAPQQDIDPDINVIKRALTIDISSKEAPRITATQPDTEKHGYEPGDTTTLLDQDSSGENPLLSAGGNFSVR